MEVKYNNNKPEEAEDIPYLAQEPPEIIVDIKQLLKQNQGTDGINPETGEVKYNPYKIPPDRQICNEFRVMRLSFAKIYLL